VKKLPVRLVEREDTAALLPELPEELRMTVANIATVAREGCWP
jgi:hypothetical protein